MTNKSSHLSFLFQSSAEFPPLVALWLSEERRQLFNFFLLALSGVLLLTLGAYIQIPFWPVPVTLQTLAVLLIGLGFGTVLGATTVALYLLLGLIGVPVFAQGAGPAYFAGPTGGYLIGFFFAALVLSYFAARGATQKWTGTLGSAIVAVLVVYVFGVAWMALSGASSWGSAIQVGVVPFLLGDAVEVVLVTLLAVVAQKKFQG